MNVEIIERKGIGHPDTIADNLSEALSEKLYNEYIRLYNEPKHYNVDKTMVCAGEIKDNVFISPVKIVFAGQYTKIKNIDKFLLEVVEDVFKFEIKKGLKYEIYNFLNEGSLDLNQIFDKKKSNDTSFAVGYKETKNDNLVLEIGEFLDNLYKTNNKIGRDNKIMLIDDGVVKKVYVSLAFMNTLSSFKKYELIKKELEEKMRLMFNINNLFINLGDSKTSKFITKTGTSLEMGDSGATGRGNRRNGLITPTKPMTLEAYYGKNKVTHIGRTYQDLARKIALEKNKNILLLNVIGGDVEDPIIFEI